MRLPTEAMRLTIHIGEDDTWQHKPLYHEVVRRAHLAGLSGASVFRGIEGYGAGSLIHTSRFLSMSSGLPMMIVIIDTEDRLRGFLPELEDLVSEGLLTLERVEVLRQPGHGPGGREG
ncbi:DUF190 domain-containing protein [Haloechinothrix sp. LS1_15]|uniref:DUF190 domain-containing protein n=1 Tax=Haloechinothrix sp. LS1_15 TaxID=2652248 RepID=UPI002945C4D4|nr:DUF190 domain-containing protein [Haloechinothrix sp. LS1_15]MDV6013354.1 DUF190 domain-containing protein [Haloechinothrix sp. LS1_15]